jgi:hypothetical protein
MISLPPSTRPLLAVVVDTEEEFDWTKPFCRSATSVTNISSQEPAQRLFDRYGLKPIYVVDYPVASQSAGYAPLVEFKASGVCDIGAHLHPWVNPPFEEEITPANSFAGNLPKPLERAKLVQLTNVISENFGVRPTVYRAGRFGLGPATADVLGELGYEVDTSVVPLIDLRPSGGPDFTNFGPQLCWLGANGCLLEVPVTAAYTGVFSGAGTWLHHLLNAPAARTARLPGLCARLGLLARFRLTPEGTTLQQMQRLTRTMLKAGHRVFNLMYHSSSLSPGHTPYVRSRSDLEQFLSTLEGFLDFFFGDLGGEATTLSALKARLDTRPSIPTA